MKNTILLSALTALTLSTVANADVFFGTFKMQKIPMNQKYLSIERGGTLTAEKAYSDGVGVIVIGNTDATTVDNTPMNELVKKYGKAAADAAETLYTYVLNNTQATAEDKALATQLQNDLANSTVSVPKTCVTIEELKAMIANNEDYSNVCTSNITNMDFLFFLKPVNYDISGWDVSNVTSMYAMFNEATNVNAQDFSKWNVSRVTDMLGMFVNTNINNASLNNWDVSSVTRMSGMFAGTPFNQNISGWNVSNVTDMSQMFRSSNFNKNISNWNVSNVTNFYEMFRDNTDFNQNLSAWTPALGANNIRFDLGATNWTLPKPTFN